MATLHRSYALSAEDITSWGFHVQERFSQSCIYWEPPWLGREDHGSHGNRGYCKMKMACNSCYKTDTIHREHGKNDLDIHVIESKTG